MPDAARDFLTSATAVCGATLFTHPIDNLKVQLQLRGGAAGAALSIRRLAAAAAALRAEAGAVGFYAGVQPAMARAATYGGVRMGLADPIRRHLGLSVWTAGLASGFLGAVVGQPMEILKVKMQADKEPSALAAARGIYRGGGLLAFGRGFSPSAMRCMLLTATQIGPYEVSKVRLAQHLSGFPLHLAASLVAGLVTTTVCSPFDVLKTRLMAGGGGGAWSLLAEGPRDLGRGWLASYLRLGPQTTFIFVFTEQLRQAVR